MSAPSPAGLVAPCLERILQSASARRYAKLRQDASALLDRLPLLLQLNQDVQPEPRRSQAESQAAVAEAPPPAEEEASGPPISQPDSQPGAQPGSPDAPAPTPIRTSAPAVSLPASPTARASAASPRPPGALVESAARELMLFLRDAVETQRPAVLEAVLDCLQKLVAFRLVQGSVSSVASWKEAPLDETAAAAVKEPPRPDFAALPPGSQAVELMCACEVSGDEAAELRALRALLSAATSSTLRLHGRALLLVVRSMANVHLSARSEVNAAAARAALTQALNVVFQRLESGESGARAGPIAVAELLGPASSAEAPSVTSFVQQFLSDAVSAVDPFGAGGPGADRGLADAFDDEDQALEDADSDGEDAGVSAPAAGAAQPASPAGSRLQATLERDALLVFRALCKLSLRTAPAPGAAEAAVARGRVLALELLHVVLENGGPRFLSSPALEEAIKRHLCLSLLRNASSTQPDTRRLCVAVFLSLLLRRREALKAEVGMFYPSVLLRPVEPAHGAAASSTPPHAASARPPPSAAEQACRMSALHALLRVAGDGQLLMDLFVNYDCDLEGANLFERTVQGLVRVARGPHLSDATASPAASLAAPQLSPEDLEARRLALQCLVTALRSLSLWHRAAEIGQLRPGKEPGAQLRVPWSLLSAEVHDARDALEEERRAVEEAEGRADAGARGEAEDEAEGEDEAEDEAKSSSDPSRRPTDGAEPAADAPLPELARDPTTRARWLASLEAGADDGPAPASGAPSPSRPPSQALAGSAGGSAADVVQSWKAFKTAFETGLAKFGKKPAAGVEFLQAKGLLGRRPAEVAAFFRKTKGLDKTKLGEYLGERDEGHVRVMHAYVDSIEFEGLDFDEAIRRFLDGFRLPGEAQKIDRLMEKFAERYVHCNPSAFGSADAAYVLAYSVILLNTDAHNPGVKHKMSKADFVRNNRGVNDGADLDEAFLGAAYDRIVHNEIKMRDDGWQPSGAGPGGGPQPAREQAGSASWLDALAALLPGRARAEPAEPDDASLRRTHEALRQRARGATFYAVSDAGAARPALDVAWEPVLQALSLLFEISEDPRTVALALAGFVSACQLACQAKAPAQRRLFLASLARCTLLHAPLPMRHKHAQAFRALLLVAQRAGEWLHEDWGEVLRCTSRFELLQQLAGGAPSDALLFAFHEAGGAGSEPEPAEGGGLLALAGYGRARAKPAGKKAEAASFSAPGSFGSIAEMGLHPVVPQGRGAGGLPPKAVLDSVDAEEIDRLFAHSARLGGDAVVEFVETLCAVAREELRPGAPPRVFSLSKIVEVAAHNMGRIRLVWARVWAVLSDFFAAVGCHDNLAVALYGVDALRQLAVKFLERDELANYSFQNDFLRPFCAVIRRSRAPAVRELVIRCCSQMVLARGANIKSGWRSMFMVFTSAAGDQDAGIVRLAFDTIERIVRDHFALIADAQAATFADAVNCLIAYTNNPHSLDVALNAVAFLRYCALQLAEGGVADVPSPEEGDRGGEELGQEPGSPPPPSAARAPGAGRIRELGGEANGAPAPAPLPESEQQVYFWFPLLLGLSELTFDPRGAVRTSALEVLFDILGAHGAAFSPAFWARVFDSVLLPIFDHVRAEVTDTTTFSDRARREEVDAWLYETCTRALQHMIALVVRFYAPLAPVLPRLLALLQSLMARRHERLAAVGVAALVRLALQAGPRLSEEAWERVMAAFAEAAAETAPDVAGLMDVRTAKRREEGDGGAAEPEDSPRARRAWSLASGAGARRLADLAVRARVQMMLVQGTCELYRQHAAILPPPSAARLLDVLERIAQHAAGVDANLSLRHSLLLAQAADDVSAALALPDPPLLRLEAEASQAYLQSLAHLAAAAPPGDAERCGVERRLVGHCLHCLERFEAQDGGGVDPQDDALQAGSAEEAAALAPLVTATLRALGALAPEAFERRLPELFPLLARLVACPFAPSEVLAALSELFGNRIGPLLRT